VIGRPAYQDNFHRAVSQRNLPIVPDVLIIAPVPSRQPRRVHLSALPAAPGTKIDLDSTQAHHARDVLRLRVGDPVELFDGSGRVAAAVIEKCDPAHVVVRVERCWIASRATQIVIASAIPKGDRADWMVEKLSELGVSRFIPLATERSVVLPKGSNKLERWKRIATESAKQSRRAGVMQIDELASVELVLSDRPQEATGWFYLSTEPSATPVLSSSFSLHPSSFAFIGPEGGWSGREIEQFARAGLTAARLTATILRVETAAVVAAAVVACMLEGQPKR
jgi:16S rRNA (uracil1498-N3)-methyltransferase